MAAVRCAAPFAVQSLPQACIQGEPNRKMRKPKQGVVQSAEIVRGFVNGMGSQLCQDILGTRLDQAETGGPAYG